MTATEVTTALILGLAGAGHCMGMCGGMALALHKPGSHPVAFSLTYHSGRLMGYGLIGGLVGSVAVFVSLAEYTVYLRVAASLLLIAVGLHTLELWNGVRQLEQLGGLFSRWLQPLLSAFMPPKHLGHALILGSLWGFLPCGLVYSALAWATVTAKGPFDGAFLMMLFGVGTLPAMLGTTLLSQRAAVHFRKRGFRRFMGVTLLLMGCWSLWLTLNLPHHIHSMNKMGAQTADGHHGAATRDSNHLHEARRPNDDVP